MSLSAGSGLILLRLHVDSAQVAPHTFPIPKTHILFSFRVASNMYTCFLEKKRRLLATFELIKMCVCVCVSSMEVITSRKWNQRSSQSQVTYGRPAVLRMSMFTPVHNVWFEMLRLEAGYRTQAELLLLKQSIMGNLYFTQVPQFISQKQCLDSLCVTVIYSGWFVMYWVKTVHIYVVYDV